MVMTNDSCQSQLLYYFSLLGITNQRHPTKFLGKEWTFFLKTCYQIDIVGQSIDSHTNHKLRIIMEITYSLIKFA